jgi:hypothetical protein
VKTCEASEMTWWSDKCYTCGHLLAAHRDANAESPAHETPEEQAAWDEANPFTPFGECSLCVMAAEQTAALAAADAALREFAEGVRTDAKAFASTLRDQTKEYIDSENERFRVIAKTYVDDQQVIAKSYIDQKDAAVRKDMPVWVNNRFVQVVKAEALKVDPRI